MNKVIAGSSLQASKNDYDWLGNGIYFWENSYDRALEYAISLKNHPQKHKSKIERPSVLGAVIDLGVCLDFIDYKNLLLLKDAYEVLQTSCKTLGLNSPENIPIGKYQDLLIRRLDCSVVEMIHKIKGKRHFDSARGVFWEGDDIYPNAGFKEKNHIQLCIRNPNCIKDALYQEN
ncbi:MAG: hypothetical protein ACTHMM_02925 [Agriterribacter sp.]